MIAKSLKLIFLNVILETQTLMAVILALLQLAIEQNQAVALIFSRGKINIVHGILLVVINTDKGIIFIKKQ